MIYQTNFISFCAVYKSNTFQGGYVSYKNHIFTEFIHLHLLNKIAFLRG